MLFIINIFLNSILNLFMFIFIINTAYFYIVYFFLTIYTLELVSRSFVIYHLYCICRLHNIAILKKEIN